MVYSASTSFFVPFLITFVLYARIFVVLRRRMAAMRVRRVCSHPPGMTSSRNTGTGSSRFLWRLRRRNRGSELKSYAESTLPAELSDDKSSSNDLEVTRCVAMPSLTAARWVGQNVVHFPGARQRILNSFVQTLSVVVLSNNF